MVTINVSRSGAAVIAVAILLALPAMAFAGSVFDDVDDTSAHAAGIGFVKESGVSLGCDANNNYCPEAAVSRDQMATFLYRLSGNDPETDPSVNAASLGGLTATDFARVGEPVDADTLDGSDSTDFLGATATAADAELLDGLDSSAFLGAGSQAVDSALLDGRDSTDFLGVSDTAADADLLDGLDSSQVMSGVAFAQLTDSLLATGSNGTAISVSADVPADGYLVINASANVLNVTGDDIFDCSIYVDGVEISSSIRQMELDGVGAVNREEDCSTAAVVPVTGSTTVVVDLRFDAIVSPSTDVDESTIYAIFVPGNITTP